MTMNRWTSLSPSDEAHADDESRAGVLLRRSVVRQPLDASALASIKLRLGGNRAPTPRRLVLRVSLAILLFLSGGGVVLSATLLGHWSPFAGAKVAPPVATLGEPLPHHALHAPTQDAPAIVAPLVPVPVIVAARPATRRSNVVAEPVAPALAEEAPAAPALAPPAPSAIAEEAAILGAALKKLRDEDDAEGALTVLDEHDRRFAASGALLDEASTTRIEALLRLGRRPRALALLDARMLEPVGRARELLASRGELRAEAERCDDAIQDFDALLADDGAADGAAERALYGRAACRSRDGDHAGARADLDAYVARFPTGRFADRARAALAR
jgi:hypothetical protein